MIMFKKNDNENANHNNNNNNNNNNSNNENADHGGNNNKKSLRAVADERRDLHLADSHAAVHPLALLRLLGDFVVRAPGARRDLVPDLSCRVTRGMLWPLLFSISICSQFGGNPLLSICCSHYLEPGTSQASQMPLVSTPCDLFCRATQDMKESVSSSDPTTQNIVLIPRAKSSKVSSDVFVLRGRR